MLLYVCDLVILILEQTTILTKCRGRPIMPIDGNRKENAFHIAVYWGAQMMNSPNTFALNKSYLEKGMSFFCSRKKVIWIPQINN
jgi:hypothetical protein